ncbi:CLUMA_CG002556, isoform A [Clunio marinus]|uniref:CLUMA_CG002556, isoform A n=1 Tax=Clunio marinus TaxID=568069 RepID=A0A1J1HLV0_9DIPT|nr:CLUMA_CG002556, isoform A [Clunio marinus]
MTHHSLCKRQFMIVISAMLIFKLVLIVRADHYYDNNLEEWDMKDDVRECIPTSMYGLLEHAEIERRTLIKGSQTSFIPSYCQRKVAERKYGRKHGRERFKRTMKVNENIFHLETLHSLPFDEVRLAQAKLMKRYMNTSVDPCEDFYSYACGNWAKYNEIPKDKVATDTFEILRESLDEALKNLLLDDVKEVKSHRKNNRKANRQHQRREAHRQRRRNAENKAKNLYSSCMNYEVIEKRGIEPLLDLLEKFGGWPLLDDSWDEKSFDWLELTATLRQYNNDILIVEWVGADIQNSNHNIIQFDQTTLGLPTREYFLKEVNRKYLDSYRNFMIKVITLVGGEDAEDRADEIIEFETNLAKITSAQEDRTNISILYQKTTLNDLQEEISGVDWIRYLSIVQERIVIPEEKVIMFAKTYMQNLVKLIDETEPSTVANYLLWRFVRHRINNLDNRFLEAKQTFYLECFGREKSPPRWKTCVNQVNSNMGMATGSLFVRKYFDENSKFDTIEMVHELQQSFREILSETDWIDESTKRLAEKKVNAMSLKIGYPDFILSHQKLDEKYSELHIHPEKYFENTLNVLRFLSREEQKKVGQPVNKTLWQTYPAIVNAFYSRSKNQIMFPAGILQPPFYHRHFPKCLNYGGIGVVIGHELTHGFDDKGRLFDKDGNLNKWWSDHSIKHFHERTKCLVQQYNKYTLADIGQAIDGETTQGENIADGGGINQAYRAYKRWLNTRDNMKTIDNEILPELNLTMTQLFFLNFGQVWCGEIRREANKNKMKTAVHSPGRFRVIGTLSNFGEFSKEFNCPLGSPMNPKTK